MKETGRTVEVFKVELSTRQRLSYAADFFMPALIAGAILSFCGALAVRRHLQAGSIPLLILGLSALAMALGLWSAAVVHMPRNFSVASDGERLLLRTRGRSFVVDKPLRVGSIILNRIPMHWVSVATNAGKVRLFSRDDDVANRVYALLSAPPPAGTASRT